MRYTDSDKTMAVSIPDDIADKDMLMLTALKKDELAPLGSTVDALIIESCIKIGTAKAKDKPIKV